MVVIKLAMDTVALPLRITPSRTAVASSKDHNANKDHTNMSDVLLV